MLPGVREKLQEEMAPQKGGVLLLDMCVASSVRAAAALLRQTELAAAGAAGVPMQSAGRKAAGQGLSLPAEDIRMLLGAAVNCSTVARQTPLHTAVERHDADCIKVWLPGVCRHTACLPKPAADPALAGLAVCGGLMLLPLLDAACLLLGLPGGSVWAAELWWPGCRGCCDWGHSWTPATRGGPPPSSSRARLGTPPAPRPCWPPGQMRS